MKKIVAMMAVACAAAVANAAAIDWSASGIVDPVKTAEQGKNVAANGWVGYVILAADYSTVTADLDAGNTDSLVASAVGASKTSSSTGKYSASTASGNVAAGSQDFYLVVLNAGSVSDATGYYVSAKTTVTVDASLDTLVGFGTQATGTKDASSWKSVGGSVPEPTTGLLVLLGMAGLALKRKVA